MRTMYKSRWRAVKASEPWVPERVSRKLRKSKGKAGKG
jgi:hypothetical protein